MTKYTIEVECEEILRRLISRHAFLQPDNKNFDIWDAGDAAEVVADLIIAIKESSEIARLHTEKDWGK